MIDQTINIANLLTNFAIAGIFVWAWLQERQERREIQRSAQERIDALTLRTLELIRDVTRTEAFKDVGQSPALKALFADVETARAISAFKPDPDAKQ
jgi:hypothetical protein